jgi:hypothetical protein
MSAWCRTSRDSGPFVSLPTVNMYLQDREAGPRTPRWRGVTVLHEMKARGLRVAVAGDNCRGFPAQARDALPRQETMYAPAPVDSSFPSAPRNSIRVLATREPRRITSARSSKCSPTAGRR